MSQSSSPQPLPNRRGDSDNRDVVILYIDGPTDLPLGEPDPALRKILAEERALILKWRPEWLQMGKKDKEPDKPDQPAPPSE